MATITISYVSLYCTLILLGPYLFIVNVLGSKSYIILSFCCIIQNQIGSSNKDMSLFINQFLLVSFYIYFLYIE